MKFIALAGFEGLLPGRQCESDEKRKVMERKKSGRVGPLQFLVRIGANDFSEGATCPSEIRIIIVYITISYKLRCVSTAMVYPR